jgi:hypothetical protein
MRRKRRNRIRIFATRIHGRSRNAVQSSAGRIDPTSEERHKCSARITSKQGNKQMDINYRNLEARAKDAALEYMPAMPKQNTLEAWEAYVNELEAIEPSECAHLGADSWDWVIYNGQALQLCSVLPSSLIGQAEAMAQDCGGIEEAFEQGGLGGVACLVAYWVCYEAVQCAIETAREELIELANGQIENLEGVAA